LTLRGNVKGEFHFRLLLNGHALSRVVNGLVGEYGFYATIFVAARDEAEAREGALRTIRNRVAETASFTGRTRIDVETVEAIDNSDVPNVQPGLVWFRE
jgi:hypothetical protein